MFTQKKILILIFSLLAITSLGAQSVGWTPNGGTLAVNQSNELTLVFEDCSPPDNFTPPKVENLQFVKGPFIGRNVSTQMVNWKSVTRSTITLTYEVRPTKKLPVEIPSFIVQTDKGNVAVPAVSFKVDINAAPPGTAPGHLANTTIPIKSLAESSIFTPRAEVWENEIIPIVYQINVHKNYARSLDSLNWDPSPLLVEEWNQANQEEKRIDGEPRILVLYSTRALVPKGNASVSTEAPMQNVAFMVGAPQQFSPFGFMGMPAQPTTETYTIEAEPLPTLTVKPLPSPAPSDFTGAVGNLTLSSKVVPEKVGVGDPVTWTLTLSGTGNWANINSLPSRSVSRSFGVIQPQAKKTLAEGKLFEGNLSEDIVVIPKQPGTYRLPAVSLSVFDPESGTYKKLTSEEHTITVTGNAMTAPAGPATTGPDTSSASLTPGQAPASPAPTNAAFSSESLKPPANLPLDPIESGNTIAAPRALRNLLFCFLIFPVALILLWWALAIRRAYYTDKYLPKRKARESLRQLLQSLSENSSKLSHDELRAVILKWQKLSTLIWDVYKSTPTFLDIPDKGWALLWKESDRILYGPAPALPGDWISRAISALQAKRIPGFNPLRFLLPSNLLAFPMKRAIPLLLLTLFLPASNKASAAEEETTINNNPVLTAYQSADFEKAEAACREIIKKNPRDWATRYNLSLVLSQKNEWPEAAAQAAAAFVQNPNNPNIRHQLHYAYLQAGSPPAELQAFLKPKPPITHKLAAWLSPSMWQCVLTLSVTLAAIAVAYSLLIAYSFKKRGSLGLLGIPLLILAIAGAAASTISLNAYGPLANPNACLVIKPVTLRSIPTELDTPQKTVSLRPGHLALSEKEFLAWHRLTFKNDQTGWLQSSDITHLWK